MEIEIQLFNLFGIQEKRSCVYSSIGLPQEARRIFKKNLTPKGTRKRRIKPKVTRRKEITKITAEINEIDTKINNTRDQ